MQYQPQTFIGKNGTLYTLRSPQAQDASKLLSYLKQSAHETEYGISYPEELNFSLQEEEDFIRKFVQDKTCIMISVFEGDTLVGNASLFAVLDKKKTRHRATFGIAILKTAWGQGLGYQILSALIEFAANAGYEQIELEVASDNLPAISLYRKLGFTVYGERPRSFKLNSGKYSDELLMILKLR